MVYHVLQDVKQSVQQRVDVAINDCFDVCPFQGLEMEHLQIEFYRDHFNLCVSCVILFCYFKIEKNYLKGKCLYFPQNSTTKVCMSQY